jgi:hypothetical protein
MPLYSGMLMSQLVKSTCHSQPMAMVLGNSAKLISASSILIRGYLRTSAMNAHLRGLCGQKHPSHGRGYVLRVGVGMFKDLRNMLN